MRVAYPGLDLVRLAAAFAVAVYHLAFWWWRDVPQINSALAPLAPVVSGGWVGVEIFFVISGFVIAFSASNKTAGQFTRGRAARLYPAAFVCATITMLVVPADLATYLRSILLFPVGPWVSAVYWTLAVELVFYALVALSIHLGWSLLRVATCLGLYSAVFWSLKAANRVLGSPADFSVIENEAGYLLLAHFGVYFAFGMLLFERRYIPALSFAAIGFVAVVWRAQALGLGTWSAPILWAIASAFILLFTRAPTPSNPLVRTLGLMTYPLYLLHAELGRAVMLQFSSPWLGLAAALLLVILASAAVLPLETAIRSLARTRAPGPQMAQQCVDRSPRLRIDD